MRIVAVEIVGSAERPADPDFKSDPVRSKLAPLRHSAVRRDHEPVHQPNTAEPAHGGAQFGVLHQHRVWIAAAGAQKLRAPEENCMVAE